MTILEVEHIETLCLRPAVQVSHLCDEVIGVAQLIQDKSQSLIIISGCQYIIGDTPHLCKPSVEADDLPRSVNHKNAVGSRFECRLEK